MLIVMKFGGTSVGSPERIAQAAALVTAARDKGHHVVAVTSAMSGVTNGLIEAAQAASKGNPDTAMRQRWHQGRARYGSEWSGRHPLVEGFEELIDTLNYLALAGAPYAERLAVQAIAERVARSIRALRPEELARRWTLDRWLQDGGAPRA